ncbi:hypothetical protein BAP_3690 [Bacillus sp. CN2]|nr:hypothetical protein BAP_3690 [Bacillus sp. CN2]
MDILFPDRLQHEKRSYSSLKKTLIPSSYLNTHLYFHGIYAAQINRLFT